MEHEHDSDSSNSTNLMFIIAGIALVVIAVAIPTVIMDEQPQHDVSGTATLVIDTPSDTMNESVELDENMTVFDVVNTTYPIEYTAYDFGYLITSIDGLAQNDTHAWLYSVNGQNATKAVNAYPVNDTDVITFRYTADYPGG